MTPQPFEWIERGQPLRFTLEGEAIDALRGDCISSALWANGVHILGRSFKYHRPRGLFSLANHDINALFEYVDDTHLRGDVTPVPAGINLTACNTLGGLKQDRYRWLDQLSPALPVGFYYKVFHKPRWLFPLWERLLRHTAGLGQVRSGWRRRITPKWYEHCDLLVIGAGPAGMAAALNAAEAGADVILVDENPHIGGSLDYQWANDAGAEAPRTALKQGVNAHPRIRVMTATVAAGYYQDQWVPLAGPAGIAKTRSRALIVATGVIEQPAVFRNNDLPGVMLASAAQRLIARYAVKPCERAVLLLANAEGYRAALDLQTAGVELIAVVDLGEPAERGPLASELAATGVEILAHHGLYAASGKDRVSAVSVAPLGADGSLDDTQERWLRCDGVILSVGWAPAAHLLYQAGATLEYSKTLEQFVPLELPPGIQAAGRVNGVFELHAQIEDGRRAARAALAELAAATNATGEIKTSGPASNDDLAQYRDPNAHSHPWPIVVHPKGKNFVDLDEDLQLKDLLQAAREGFDNIELLKRFSTVGMGPSQGKHANMNAIRVLAKVLGKDIDETGSTTARPFYHPLRLDDLAGRRFRVHQRSALHERHEQAGACFMEAGAWHRPEYYGKAEQREVRVREEVAAVRSALGLIDVSTLGKIEVLGRDAARLLDAAYSMRMTRLKLGMTRYALMVDEAGVIIDDGIVGRLGEQHYYLTATSSHANATYRSLTRFALEWGLQVRLVNRTGQLSAMNLAGPNSRRLLAELVDIDLSDDAFPYLGLREGTIGDIPARLMRVGFVGELGYEIHVPYHRGAELWDLLMRKGQPYGIRPFGVEAQRRLRMEKGHIIVGQDTDGLTTPFEVGMSWAVHLKKPFFVGQRSLQILKPRTARSLVGFELEYAHGWPEVAECHLVIVDGDIRGRVTSVAFSPARERIIGMALVDSEVAGLGRTLPIRATDGVLVTATQVAMPFYDPDGLRQQADLQRQEVA
ncbi:MAG: glycine cleavage T C-terminal barrel domain-containing protein [Lamprobacter sp.]|uniref:2Fe-2S iron-sulfur cluster-binding protein n=1 Tax=Lamprobacter sp. TaxID=3100796 RepID=UPI002B258B24|nr:2Fe-2S iron-sulfur cluster-binding protein [Lamprobacter sp.]MEA3642394.1 glycine cleavage T C-terminal barrel domain-containing protein [Lamprobacter sp.]